MAAFSLVCLALVANGPGHANEPSLRVEPGEIRLRGSDATAQIVVTFSERDQLTDATDTAKYETDAPAVVAVGSSGLASARGDGVATIIVTHAGATGRVKVVVEDFANTRPIAFAGEVVPILTKMGCNAGNCHGKASGQNGFRLSLLGFDPNFDFEVLAREGRGRRVFPAAPEASLLVQKATARVPHGGGRKLEPGSPEHRTIVRWIAQGMPRDTGRESKLARIDVTPERRLMAAGQHQQLRVTATYDDGATIDATRLAQYQSNAADLALVDERGRIEALDGTGEAAIMVRFDGKVTVARAILPLRSDAPEWQPPASGNLVDRHLFARLRELGIPPSEACTDAEFARRSMLDICGRLPTPGEVAGFERDTSAGKRRAWVAALVDRPEYADNFAMKWSAILRNQRGPFGNRGQSTSFAFHSWVRESLAENKPYDQFAAELITARGDASNNPAVAWYRNRGLGQNADEQLTEIVDDTAQLFLGMRIQCARCHHHPYEKWSQDDYYGFASFFTRLDRKASGNNFVPRIFVKSSGLARNPATLRDVPPTALDGPAFDKLGPRDDPRDALAQWLRQPDNPFFAKALVNRYWKHFFGRGLVEPEDDMRVSNPPTNPELLDALAADFIQSGYDLKHLARVIAGSQAYGLSSAPNAYNAPDRQSFSRFYARRLPAEVLLDAVNVVALSAESFPGLPKGFRAVELPDEGQTGNLGEQGGGWSYFLDVFGRPKRESVCECERTTDASLSQRLHLLNSNEVESKVSGSSGRAAGYADPKDTRGDAAKVEELYRLAFSRTPTADELEVCLSHVAKHRESGTLKQGFEDLVWTLINSKEFVFNR